MIKGMLSRYSELELKSEAGKHVGMRPPAPLKPRTEVRGSLILHAAHAHAITLIDIKAKNSRFLVIQISEIGRGAVFFGGCPPVPVAAQTGIGPVAVP